MAGLAAGLKVVEKSSQYKIPVTNNSFRAILKRQDLHNGKCQVESPRTTLVSYLASLLLEILCFHLDLD